MTAFIFYASWNGRGIFLSSLTALFRVHRTRLVSPAIPGNRICVAILRLMVWVNHRVRVRPPKTKTKTNKQNKNRSMASKAMSVVQAITHFQVRTTPFCDLTITNNSASTTSTEFSILAPLVSVMAGNLQITKPITWGGGNVRYTAGVIVHGVLLKIRTIGAQGTTLLAGDLYNSVRTIVYQSGSTYADTPDGLGGGVDQWYNPSDVVKLHYDHTFHLPTQAYDASANNSPQVLGDQLFIPVNTRFDFFSLNSSGATWDTKKGDLLVIFVSDSGITPHPTVNISCRLYYDFVQ